MQLSLRILQLWTRLALILSLALVACSNDDDDDGGLDGDDDDSTSNDDDDSDGDDDDDSDPTLILRERLIDGVGRFTWWELPDQGLDPQLTAVGADDLPGWEDAPAALRIWPDLEAGPDGLAFDPPGVLEFLLDAETVEAYGPVLGEAWVVVQHGDGESETIEDAWDPANNRFVIDVDRFSGFGVRIPASSLQGGAGLDILIGGCGTDLAAHCAALETLFCRNGTLEEFEACEGEPIVCDDGCYAGSSPCLGCRTIGFCDTGEQVCGNSIVEGCEICDDGPDGSCHDDCSAENVCGDGIAFDGELCDDGPNGSCHDDCSAENFCGDSIVFDGEVCDDGTGGVCFDDCSAQNVCGDGIAFAGEACDDGPNGVCFDDCTAQNVCGDGIVFAGEACDDGPGGTCLDDCAGQNVCGDGVAFAGEVCDDGPGGACFDDCSGLNVCGDGIVFGGEVCDEGIANATTVCGCQNDCRFQFSGRICRTSAGPCDVAESCDGAGACPADGVQPAGTVCRTGSGDSCDSDETCDGAGTTCPVDVVAAPGAVCRVGSGDLCDPQEVCTGVAGDPCPTDVLEPATTVCNPGTGDVCDPDEFCTGVGGQACPVDAFEPATTVCRAGSGDLCDPDEFCVGAADTPCPADLFEPATTVCNPGSGDLCDPDELCTGVAGDACPADAIEPNTTVCQAGSGDACDPDEFCTGVADALCPADFVAPAATVCRPGSGDLCDPDEVCTGVAGALCPADGFAAAGVVCRPAVGPCNPSEVCLGAAGSSCPVDGFAVAGTLCGDPRDDTCTDPDVCDSGGVCLTNDVADGLVCSDCGAGAGSCGFCSAGVCPNAICGNLVTEQGEDCDSGGFDAPACDADCSANVCGDGYLNANTESCDDGLVTGQVNSCQVGCVGACDRAYVADIMVAPGGDGLSWTTAFDVIQDAVDAANADAATDQVWVRSGTYTDAASALMLNLPAGLQLYGSFAGNECFLADRPALDVFATDPTSVLDKGNNGRILAAASGTLVDGFLLRNANTQTVTQDGACLRTRSDVTFRNTVFDTCLAENGGALHVTDASLTMENAIVRNSLANGQGAGLYFSNPGGGSLNLTNVEFTGNQSQGSGGGLYVSGGAPLTVFTWSGGKLNNNRSFTGAGGGIFAAAADADLSGFEMISNFSDGNGGGIFLADGSLIADSLLNSVTLNQTFNGSGGAIYADNSSVDLSNTSFVQNYALNEGGNVSVNGNVSLAATLTDNGFADGSADFGGGVSLVRMDATISGCAFTGNVADFFGGGLYIIDGNTLFNNAVSTFTGNTAMGGGGGVYDDHTFGGSAFTPAPPNAIYFFSGNAPDDTLSFP